MGRSWSNLKSDSLETERIIIVQKRLAWQVANKLQSRGCYARLGREGILLLQHYNCTTIHNTSLSVFCFTHFANIFIYFKNISLFECFGGLKKGPLLSSIDPLVNHLSSFSSDTTSKLNVLGHDGDALGVDGAQVGVLKQTNEIGLTSLLESSNGSTLEPEVSLEILGNFSH